MGESLDKLNECANCVGFTGMRCDRLTFGTARNINGMMRVIHNYLLEPEFEFVEDMDLVDERSVEFHRVLKKLTDEVLAAGCQLSKSDIRQNALQLAHDTFETDRG